MSIEVLMFHMLVLIPMVYFIWKDGYEKGLNETTKCKSKRSESTKVDS